MQARHCRRGWRGLMTFCLLLASAAAPAASFDCAKASAKVEKAICADQELSSLDERMAAAYKKQLTAWQGEIAAYVRNDQREFIKRMRTAHEGEIEDGLECAKAYVTCIRRMLSERVGVLESAAYRFSGVYARPGYKLLLTARPDGEFDVLLFDKSKNLIRSTLKEQGRNGDLIRPGASSIAASGELVSRLGEGATGDAVTENCEVRLQMSGKQAALMQSGKCGTDFSGKYQRLMQDRVENYANTID